MKRLLFAVMLLAASTVLRAQQNDLPRVLASAYASIETGVEHDDKTALMRSYSVLGQALAQHPGNPYVLYALSFAEYRLIVKAYVAGDDDLFSALADSAVAHLERIAYDPVMKSDACALLGSIYGMKISKSWIKAPILGPKSNRFIEEAIAADSSNPRAWFFAGVSKYSTPEFFGGSKDEAATCFARAITCAERESTADSLRPHWGLVDAMIWSGRTAEEKNNFRTAESTYRHVLEIAPEYGWVKFVLLPGVEKKLGAKGK